MAKPLTVIIAGGGTGGHLFPAIAIGEELLHQRPETNIHYMGSLFGIEANVFPLRPHPFTLLPIRGLQRGIGPKAMGRNLLLPFRLSNSLYRTRRVFNRVQPDMVVGTGGYASALPLRLAGKKQISYVIQEQNSYPGLTTRSYAKKAKKVCAGFKETAAALKGIDTIVTGNPVRKDIETGDRHQGGIDFKLDPQKKTLFLFGGSQGSVPLNNLMSEIIDPLCEKEIQILWQTGPDHYSRMKKYDNDLVRVTPFINHMANAYALSDLVLSRAGALALAEITLCGKPSILVPLPSAAAQHQMKNARALGDAKAAKVLDQHTLSPDALLQSILILIEDNDALESMGQQAKKFGKPDATRDIVNNILEIAET